MDIKKCSRMKNELAITMYEEKIKKISKELDNLYSSINESQISLEEVAAQIEEIWDFTNSSMAIK